MFELPATHLYRLEIARMNIILKPEYERSIAKQIAKGRFASVDEVLDYIFELLEASEIEYDRWVEQTQPKVQSAIEQLDSA
jgi:Arc/MetJ-type ribon-helix-helix transcriptional regulator